jgi:drug/metabolite transporter (DMT)-like permease
MSAVQFLSAAVVNAILALIFESPIAFGAISDSFGAVLYLGIGSSGIAYTLQIIGQRGTDPAAASILLSLESVFGVLGAAILLSEKLLVREYIGCAVVFTAVLISELDLGAIIKKFKEKKKGAAEESGEDAPV